MKPLKTMRVTLLRDQSFNECDAVNYIYSEIPPGEDGMVFIAIPLGKGQFDLAVNQDVIRRVNDHVRDLSSLRLLSCDPLFAAECGRSSRETAFHALTHMISQYNNAADPVYMSKDPLLINWFKAETDRLDALLKAL